MRILAQDGGGVRGALEVGILTRLYSEHDSLIDEVDVLAGSSTGAINAVALACGLSPLEMVDFYASDAARVFSHRDWKDRWLGKLDEVWRAHYDNQQGLGRVLSERLGASTKLGDLPKLVLFPVVYLGDEKRCLELRVLHNWPDSPFLEWGVVDALIQATAAPVYFPSVDTPDRPGQSVDGGLGINNPSFAAVAQAIRESGVDPADISVLSIGAGRNPRALPGGDLGVAGWVSGDVPIVTAFLESQVGAPSYYCRAILNPDHYLRIDPRLPGPVDTDDVSAIPRLLDAAGELDLGESVNWIKSGWRSLLSN